MAFCDKLVMNQYKDHAILARDRQVSLHAPDTRQTLHQRKKNITENLRSHHNMAAQQDRSLMLSHLPLNQLCLPVDHPDAPRTFSDEHEYNNEGSSGFHADDEEDLLALRTGVVQAWQPNFRQQLTPGIMYQVHQEMVLRSHREIDLSLSDQMTNLVKFHSSKGLDFTKTRLFSRSDLVKTIAEVCDLTPLKPTTVNVKLLGNKMATVPVFDIRSHLVAKLTDPELMQEKFFIPGYDILTGQMENNDMFIGETVTGSDYKAAHKRICRDDPDVMALPLQAFYDASYVDTFGSLQSSPFIVTPLGVQAKFRHTHDWIIPMGLVPHLKYGKGKADRELARNKLQDEHNCLAAVLAQLREIYNHGGFWLDVMGKKRRVIPWIQFVGGDISGMNSLTGAFNVNGKTARPYRDCMCCFDDLDDPYAVCQYFTMSQYRTAKEEGTLKSLSIHHINNAMETIPLGNERNGIFYSPPDALHCIPGGVIKRMIACTHDIIGPKKTNLKEKDKFNCLHQKLVHDASRQSEKDLPRMSSRNGAFDGTKMTANEIMGCAAVIAVAANTVQGRNILKPGLESRNIKMVDFHMSLYLILSYYEWLHDPHHKEDIKDARYCVAFTMELIKDCFPRDSGNGWNIPKFHSLPKFLRYMLKSGDASNFTTEWGERSLKKLVKDVAVGTQKIPSKFVTQAAQRIYEENVIEFAYENIVAPHFGLPSRLDRHNDVNTNISTSGSVVLVSGQYSMMIGHSDRHGRGGIDYFQWKSHTRRSTAITVHSLVEVAIRSFACDQGYRGTVAIKGYTKMRRKFSGLEKPVIFHANELYHGRPWYDWCMVQFHEEDIPAEEALCPCLILGFFQYNQHGIPTPQFSIEEGMTMSEISDKLLLDKTLYAVVYAASAMLPWYELENNFISSFRLGDIDECLYIVNVNTIVDPLVVFKNYGGESDSHLCMLPRRKWSTFFSNNVATLASADRSNCGPNRMTESHKKLCAALQQSKGKATKNNRKLDLKRKAPLGAKRNTSSTSRKKRSGLTSDKGNDEAQDNSNDDYSSASSQDSHASDSDDDDGNYSESDSESEVECNIDC